MHLNPYTYGRTRDSRVVSLELEQANAMVEVRVYFEDTEGVGRVHREILSVDVISVEKFGDAGETVWKVEYVKGSAARRLLGELGVDDGDLIEALC